MKSAAGSAVVRMGSTAVVAGVKLETGYEPCLVPNIDLGPFCSAKFKPGPPGDLAMSIAARLDDLVKATKLLPLERLVIEEGKAAWVIYIDIVCLNYDGNIFDAAWMSLLAALMDTKLPLAEFDVDLAKATFKPEFSPLPLNERVYACSFAIFDHLYLLADPDDDEEELCMERICVVLDIHGRLRLLSSGGAVSMEHLDQCIQLAQVRTKELANVQS